MMNLPHYPYLSVACFINKLSSLADASNAGRGVPVFDFPAFVSIRLQLKHLQNIRLYSQSIQQYISVLH